MRNYAGEYAAVGGGSRNRAQGKNSTIPGGNRNATYARDSFAAGSLAKAHHAGSFVWQDTTPDEIADTLASEANNQFIARASGGFKLISTAHGAALTLGAELRPNEATWDVHSSVKKKKDFTPVDVGRVLQEVASLDITKW